MVSLLQLGPEQGVQLSQDGNEPAARDSTVQVSPGHQELRHAPRQWSQDPPSTWTVWVSEGRVPGNICTAASSGLSLGTWVWV